MKESQRRHEEDIRPRNDNRNAGRSHQGSPQEWYTLVSDTSRDESNCRRRRQREVSLFSSCKCKLRLRCKLDWVAPLITVPPPTSFTTFSLKTSFNSFSFYIFFSSSLTPPSGPGQSQSCDVRLSVHLSICPFPMRFLRPLIGQHR